MRSAARSGPHSIAELASRKRGHDFALFTAGASRIDYDLRKNQHANAAARLRLGGAAATNAGRSPPPPHLRLGVSNKKAMRRALVGARPSVTSCDPCWRLMSLRAALWPIPNAAEGTFRGDDVAYGKNRRK